MTESDELIVGFPIQRVGKTGKVGNDVWSILMDHGLPSDDTVGRQRCVRAFEQTRQAWMPSTRWIAFGGTVFVHEHNSSSQSEFMWAVTCFLSSISPASISKSILKKFVVMDNSRMERRQLSHPSSLVHPPSRFCHVFSCAVGGCNATMVILFASFQLTASLHSS